jgi:dTDP-4-amino-4,6-dideoxygalactose transaminase
VSRVPTVDLARRVATLEPELTEAISRALHSGWFILGPETEAFELELAAFCGRRHAVAVASGTRVSFDTAVHYARALTQQPAYMQFVRDPCPRAEAWAAECVSLPCFPELSDDEVTVVCETLQREASLAARGDDDH